MDNLILLQEKLTELIKDIETVRIKHLWLLENVSIAIKTQEDYRVLPKDFREVLDIISVKDKWTKDEILTVFKESLAVSHYNKSLRRG